MRDYFSLGPTPVDEPCEQVGMETYSEERARLEARTFKHQLQRLFPELLFIVKKWPHDFGFYYDVIVSFEEEQISAACNVDNNTPLNWDDISKEELRKAGYFHN